MRNEDWEISFLRGNLVKRRRNIGHSSLSLTPMTIESLELQVPPSQIKIFIAWQLTCLFIIYRRWRLLFKHWNVDRKLLCCFFSSSEYVTESIFISCWPYSQTFWKQKLSTNVPIYPYLNYDQINQKKNRRLATVYHQNEKKKEMIYWFSDSRNVSCTKINRHQKSSITLRQ